MTKEIVHHRNPVSNLGLRRQFLEHVSGPKSSEIIVSDYVEALCFGQ